MKPASILVLGAGELGKAVLQHLAARRAAHAHLRLGVLLRPETLASQEKSKRQDVVALRAQSIELLAGDLAAESPEALVEKFRPFDTVVCCTGFVGGSGTQLKITRAVLAAGVARYVPWQFGVDYDAVGRGSGQDVWDEQLDVRDLLRAQDRTRWIIVSTGMFTSFLFESSFGVVDLAQNTVHALGGWDNAVTVTTPDDIGRLTAAILFAEPPISNQVVYTAGDTLTYGQLADTVDAVLGRQLQRIAWSLETLREDLARHPEDGIRKYRVAFGAGRGVSWNPDRTFNAKHGIKTVGVEQWARENLRQRVEAHLG